MNYERLKENIKHHEGFRRKVYKDTLGIETIGYGFAIKDLLLDDDVARIILERKLTDLVIRCFNTFSWIAKQPPAVQEVVIEMCYQLGIAGFSKFQKTIKFLKEGDYKSASLEILRSRWAKQTPNRAVEMSDRIKSCSTNSAT